MTRQKGRATPNVCLVSVIDRRTRNRHAFDVDDLGAYDKRLAFAIEIPAG
ncbi:hypothetical protein [Paraburkholderia ultramafica]|nr:hypothetical protein [Paraburkholderia ultramafica]